MESESKIGVRWNGKFFTFGVGDGVGVESVQKPEADSGVGVVFQLWSLSWGWNQVGSRVGVEVEKVQGLDMESNKFWCRSRSRESESKSESNRKHDYTS